MHHLRFKCMVTTNKTKAGAAEPSKITQKAEGNYVFFL